MKRFQKKDQSLECWKMLPFLSWNVGSFVFFVVQRFHIHGFHGISSSWLDWATMDGPANKFHCFFVRDWNVERLFSSNDCWIPRGFWLWATVFFSLFLKNPWFSMKFELKGMVNLFFLISKWISCNFWKTLMESHVSTGSEADPSWSCRGGSFVWIYGAQWGIAWYMYTLEDWHGTYKSPNLERKIIFIMFHVNLQGCISIFVHFSCTLLFPFIPQKRCP